MNFSSTMGLSNHLNFPFGLSDKLINELTDHSDSSETNTDIDKKIVEKIKNSPENLIDYLSACLKDKDYLEQHQDLAEKLLKRADKFFIKQKFSKTHKENILAIIKSSPFALEHGKTLLFNQNDKNIPLNRICMIAESEVFQTRALSKLEKDKSKKLKKDKLEKDKYEVDVNNISPETLNVILNFLVNGELPQLEDAKLIQEIMGKAHEWEIDSLLNKLPEHCLITTDNVVAIYQAANLYSQEKIKNKTLDFLNNQDLDFDTIESLYEFAKSEKLPELIHFCQGYIFGVLLNKKNTFETHQIIGMALPILKANSSFSKEHLAALSAQQILILIEYLREKIQALDLSVYTEDEIELLIQVIPPYVQELKLSGKALSSATIDALAFNFPLLRKLDLSNAVKWNKENPEKFDEVDWSSLAGLKHLTSLNITNCPAALPFIELIIMQSPDLEELKMIMFDYIKGYKKTDLLKLNDACAYLLGKYCPKLSTLEISYLSSKGIDALYFNDRIMKNLTSLSLTGLYTSQHQYPNRFDLISLGTKFPNLKCLKLKYILYDNEAFEKLGTSLKQLEELELSWGEGNAQDPLYHFAKNCPNLRKVAISCTTSDEGFEHLVTNCPNLRSLRIHLNPHQFDLLIKSKVNLKEFDLSYQSTSIPEWINENRLLDLSSRFPNLTYLSLPDFSENISEKTFDLVFSKLNQLEKLKIYTNEKNEIFLKSIKNCHNLKYLSIFPNRLIGNRYFSENIAKLSELKNLKHLDCHLRCKSSDISHLITKLPNLKTVNFYSIIDSIDDLIDKIISNNTSLNSLTLEHEENYTYDNLLKLINNTNLKKLHLTYPDSMPKTLSAINEVKNIVLAKHPHLKSFTMYGRSSKFSLFDPVYSLSRKIRNWKIYQLDSFYRM